MGHKHSPQNIENVFCATTPTAPCKQLSKMTVSSPFENPGGQQFLPPPALQHKQATSPMSLPVCQPAGRDGTSKPAPEAPISPWFTALLSDPHSISRRRTRPHFLPLSFLGAICTFLQMVFCMVILAELQTIRKDFHKSSHPNLLLG